MLVKNNIARIKQDIIYQKSILNSKTFTASVLKDVTKKAIKCNKRLIAVLKQQLPQRIPVDKLRRCPFCGGRAHINFNRFLGNYVICEKYEVATPYFGESKKAIEVWNRRK